MAGRRIRTLVDAELAPVLSHLRCHADRFLGVCVMLPRPGRTAGLCDECRRARRGMVGFGMHIVAGYAWDEHNVIACEGNSTLFSSDYYNSTSLFSSSSFLSAQGIEGASWYHYAGPTGRSFFTVVGLGFCVFDRGEAYHSAPGGGYLLGGGYEFARHFQVGLYFSGGRTFDAGHDFNHRHLSLLLSGFAF